MNQKEIARLSGVSTATVSRVINKDPRVSQKTRQAVEKVLDRYSYVANLNARNLRVVRTKTVGYLISSFNNPYFISIYEGLEEMLSTRGYNVIIGITNEDPKTQREAIDLLLSYKVCGIVGSFVEIDETTRNKLRQMCDFVISLDRRIPDFETDYVGVDNIFGGIEQVRHAASHGHKKIAVIYGTQDSVGTERLGGYTSAMEELGLDIRPEYMVPGNFNEAESYRATLSLLHLADPPTAILAHNNMMCIGAYKAIRDMHLDIPDDISLIGFDNFSLADYLGTGITLIEHPAYEMGQVAAQLLFERLDSRRSPSEAPRQVILPVKLIIRGSCKIL